MAKKNVPRKGRGYWGREVVVYALLYGIPLALLFPGFSIRPDAQFLANVRTMAVEFTLDDYRESGLFTGGIVDVTFDNAARVELPRRAAWRRLNTARPEADIDGLTGGTVTFRGVRFQSLVLPPGTNVRVEWFAASPTGVRLLVRYSTPPVDEAATVFVGKRSVLQFSGARVTGEAVAAGEVDVGRPNAGLARVYLSPDGLLSISITPRPAMPPTGPGQLPAESNLRLLAGSAVSFENDDGGSAIFGDGNFLEVFNADRRSPVRASQTLQMADLAPGTMMTLSVADGLAVAVRGVAGTLVLDEDDGRPSPAEYLRAQKVLATWITTSLLIGTAALTVASRIKLVKLEGQS